MKSQFLFMLLWPLLFLGCIDDSRETKILEFEDFSIIVPADWESFTSQGYDSKVGGITNGKIVLTYDYGWYSSDFQNETADSHLRTITTIDGRPALIVQPLKKGTGIIGVYIEVGNQMRFNLMGRDIKDEDKVIKIFDSIKFHDS